jgi:hypothetical protein
MSYRAILLFASALLFTAARSENSIVVGQGIKVDGVYESAGDWQSGYVWLINARQTISGPAVKGKLRIVAVSHAQPKDSYLKTVQLFVLSPVAADRAESSSEPGFSLIASSPVYAGNKEPMKRVKLSSSPHTSAAAAELDRHAGQ